MADTPGLDDYLKSITSSGKKSAVSTPGLDQYLAERAPSASVAAPQPQQSSTDEFNPSNPNRPQSFVEPSTSHSLGRLPIDLAKGYGQSVVENYQGGINTLMGGVRDIAQSSPASGVGKIGLGALGAMTSPVTGALKEFVEKPITQLTGSSDIGERASLVAGSALPISTAARGISKLMPTNKAISALVDSVGPDNLAAGIARMKENPRLTVMDVFPSVKMMGQKLITTEGQHQNKFVKFIEDRMGSRKGIIEDIYHDATGTPANVLLKLNELKKNIKDAGKEINPIIASAKPVDISDVVSGIDAKLKPGVNSIISAGQPLPLGDIEKPLAALRKFLTDDKSVRTDPSSLHQFQSALRAKADDLMNSPSGQDRQLGYALMNVRGQMVDAIDASAPGYKKALSKYRDENQVQDAFDKGFAITKNRPGVWDDRPEFWEEWIKGKKQADGTYVGGASKAELEAAREGAKVAFDQQINGLRGAGRKGMDIPEVDFNRQKLEMMFGKKEIDTMAKRLADERDISTNNADMIRNSQTAMRMKADKKIDLPEQKPSSLTGPLALAAEAGGQFTSGLPGAGLLVAAPSIMKTVKHKYMDVPLALRKNERLTDFMTATGPERDELIKILEQHLPQPKQSMMNRLGTIAPRLIAP